MFLKRTKIYITNVQIFSGQILTLHREILKKFGHIFWRNIDISETNFEEIETIFQEKYIGISQTCLKINLRQIFRRNNEICQTNVDKKSDIFLSFFFKFVWKLLPENVDKSILGYAIIPQKYFRKNVNALNVCF